ncbi:outer membrane lipoprotein-sorting protein [Petrimonas sulfuriphila]|jgi:outer membrane lipoprotein-sorting protein|uniref:outer membrane lipoprotein-sorting protein n=1 Tax=Petrimonas sulfuriphila TaxID=285070 RepID=UPI003EBE25A1
MKKMKIQSVVLTTLIVAGSIFSANAQDAATILMKMDDVMYSSKDMTGKNKIVLIDRNGKQEIREATIQQKGNDKRMFRFTSPASQAGISVLSLPDDVMYLYLPAFGKERRIATSAKNQNFAGTDFSYDDMESVLFSAKYTPKLLKTEADVFVLELTPLSRSDYSKVIVRINKTNFYPELMEYYDKGNTKIKEAKYTFKKIGNYWNASEIEMTDLKKNHKTKMQMSDVKYDQGLTDDDFTVRKLKQ